MSKKNTKVKKIKRSKRKEAERPKVLPVHVRIYPSEEQMHCICQNGGNCRFVYNNLVSYYDEKEIEFNKNKTTDDEEFKFDFKEFGIRLTGLRGNPEYEFLKLTNSKILQPAVRHLITAFHNHFSNPSFFEKPKKKKKNNHYSFEVRRDAIPGGRSEKMNCIRGNRISICTGLEDILYDCSKRDMKKLNSRQNEIRSVTVSMDPSGKCYASILMCNDKVTMEELDTMIGFDLGLKEFMISHRETIEKDDEGFVALTGDNITHEHMPTLMNFKEENEKEHAYSKKMSKIEYLQKKYRHHQKLLSRKEYNKNTHTTQRNRKVSEKKLAHIESRRAEKFEKYKQKRAKAKPFKFASKELKNAAKKARAAKRPPVQLSKSPKKDKPWQKSSNRYEKQRKTAANSAEKIANVRNNYHQKLSTDVVRQNQMIGSEDLYIEGMMKCHNMAYSIQQTGWGEFLDMISYKSLLYGRQFIRIDRFFPSTKKCSKCGHIMVGLTLNDREWVCPICGTHHDRDENASDNIATESVLTYNKKLYETLNGEPFSEPISEINLTTLPLSSGRWDGEGILCGHAKSVQQVSDEASKECETK